MAKKKLSAFEAEFAKQRAAQGPGKTFSFNGKSYTTNRADDKAGKTTSPIPKPKPAGMVKRETPAPKAPAPKAPGGTGIMRGRMMATPTAAPAKTPARPYLKTFEDGPREAPKAPGGTGMMRGRIMAPPMGDQKPAGVVKREPARPYATPNSAPKPFVQTGTAKSGGLRATPTPLPARPYATPNSAPKNASGVMGNIASRMSDILSRKGPNKLAAKPGEGFRAQHLKNGGSGNDKK